MVEAKAKGPSDHRAAGKAAKTAPAVVKSKPAGAVTGEPSNEAVAFVDKVATGSYHI
jgi:hypothetical protein